jgi:NAD-dependent DNA ligase
MSSWTKKDEYEFMETYLLLHKYLYYEKDTSIVEDSHFDSAEAYTKRLARELEINTTGLDPSNMVGFNIESPYWEKCKESYKRFL